MIATDKIHSSAKRLMHFSHIISAIIIPRLNFLALRWLRPNNDYGSKETKSTSGLCNIHGQTQTLCPVDDFRSCSTQTNTRWEATELRGPVCPTATAVSPPGSPLNFWYFTQHPVSVYARIFIFSFFFPGSLFRGGAEAVTGYNTWQITAFTMRWGLGLSQW